MTRPTLLSKLHQIQYDLRDLGASGEESKELQLQFDALITEGAEQYKCSEEEFKTIVQKDYGTWVRQQGLPWIGKKRISDSDQNE